MDTLRTDIVVLLVNYMENRCSPADLEQVKHLLSEGGYEAEWLAALAQVQMNMPEGDTKAIPAEKAAILYKRIDHTITSRSNVVPLKKSRWKWIAAAVLTAMAFTGFWLWDQRRGTASPPLLETMAAAGQQKFLTLADGTRIWLNNSSTIRYPSGFTGNSRDVYLEGEAFFDVAHNSQQPFRVHLPSLTVQVYGTSFNIRSYFNDPAVAVAVATGKVGVADPGKGPGHEYLLLPGDLLSYNREDRTYEKSNIPIAAIDDWKDGKVVFNEETLETISHALERKYGVIIHLDDKMLRLKRITLKLKPQERLPDVLTVMQLTSGIAYRQQGNEIWMEKTTDK